MLTQAPVMWINEGEIGPLWLLGLILLAFMALPGIGAALVGSRFARDWKA